MTATVHKYHILAEWDFDVYDSSTQTVTSTTHYWSNHGEEITHGGNTYLPRILDVSGLSSPYMDRKERTFGELTLTLANEADDWSTDFPFKVLNGVDDFEDKAIRVYVYDAVLDTKTLLFWGITKRPTFDPTDLKVDLTATFLWDAIDIQIPSIKLGHRCPYTFGASVTETQPGAPSVGCPYNPGGGIGTGSFTSCGKSYQDCKDRGMISYFGGWTKIAPVIRDDRNNAVDREKIREAVVPIVHAATDDIIKPEIIRAKVIGDELFVNFLVTGVNPGHPVDSGVIVKEKVLLFNRTPASAIVIKDGTGGQTAGKNKNYWPTDEGHSWVCWVAARFPLSKDQVKDMRDDVPFHAVTVKLAGSLRKDQSGSVPASLPYVLKDVLQDPILGLNLPDSYFDSSALASAHSVVATKFPNHRVELDKPEGLQDLVTHFLSTFHGYITWNDGTMQIGAKHDAETSIATFGTGGRDILNNNEVECEEADFGDIVNELQVTYRSHERHKRQFIYYDAPAQIKAGNGTRKKVSEEIFLLGIANDDQAMVSAATYMREEINANLKIRFRCATQDGLDILPGKIITVNSEHIWTDVTTFRVIGREYDPDSETFTLLCHVYVAAVYANNADPLDGDPLRGGGDNNNHGRAPNVENVTATIIDSHTTDDDTVVDTVECSWEYPADSTAADGHDTERSVDAVQIYWRFTTERAFNLRPGPRINYPNTTATLDLPHHKVKGAEFWFVSLGKSGGHGDIGYIPDPAQVTALTADITSTQLNLPVEDSSQLSTSNAIIENEIFRIVSIPDGTHIIADDTAGNRKAGLDSTAVAHTDGTEVAMAIPSYPTAEISKTNRYTLPQVTGVVARNRRRGVRVKWDNLPDYEMEKYFLYWSFTDLDNADAFVTGWGTTSDPFAPPAGINLVKCGKKPHHLIPQEDIDAAYGGDATGVAIQVRVAAKVKRNFSSALSAGTGAAHANKPLYAPADPVFPGDIRFVAVPGSNRVHVEVDVYFDTTHDATTGHTAAEAECTYAGIKLARWNKTTSAYETKLIPKTEQIEADTDRFITIDFTLQRGSKWKLVRAFTGNDAGRRKSADVNIVFHANDQEDELAGITDFEIAAFENDPLLYDEDTDSTEIDPRHSLLLYKFTMPSTIVALDHIQVQKKKDDAIRWNRSAPVDLTDDEDDDGNAMDTTGVKRFRQTVQHKKDTLMDYRARLVATDGSKSAWVTLDASSSNEGSGGGIEDTSAPGAPTGPRIQFRHGHMHLKAHRPTTGNNTIVVYEWEVCNDSTFTAGTGVKFLLETNPLSTSGTSPKAADSTTVPTSFGNSLDGGSHPHYSLALKKADLSSLFGPTDTIYCRVRAWNLSTGGNQQGTWSSASSGFSVATGDVASVDDTGAPDPPGTPTALFKQGKLRCKTTRPGVNETSIYQYEWQLCSDNTFPNTFTAGTVVYFTDTDSTLFESTTHHEIITSGVHLPIPVKRAEIVAAGFTTIYMRVRAYNRYSGSTAGSWSSTGSVTVSSLDPDAAVDTAAPGSPTSVTALYRRGHLRVRATAPATNNNTIFRYKWEIFNGSTWLTDSTPVTQGSQIYFYSAGPKNSIAVKKADLAALSGSLTIRCWAVNMANNTETESASPGTTTFSLATMEDDGSSVPNPATVASAPTFKDGHIGNGGLFAAFSKPSDERPYIQHYEFQFADNGSSTLSTARDWLDADTGTAAYTSVAPNTDAANTAAVGLANATFTSSHRFTTNHLRKRDLANTFKSGSANGTLTLFVRARIVDLDDTGVLRYGNWSTFNTITFKSTHDKDTDAPIKNRQSGRANYIEGMGCYGAANAYPNPALQPGGLASTSNHLGKDIRYGRGSSANLIATFASLYSTGNRYDSGREGIYWDKSTRAIEIYGNANPSGKSINALLFGHIPANTLAWICFAIRSNGSQTFTNGFTTGIWDTGAGAWLYSVVTGSISLTSSFKLFYTSFNLGPSITGPLVWSFSPGAWSPAVSVPMYITEAILSIGPEPKTAFEPGPQESKVDYATGVSKADSGSLSTLRNSGGMGSDSLSTWAFVDLT